MAITKEELQIIITAQDKASGAFKSLSGSLGNLGGTVLKGAVVGLGATVAGLGLVGGAAIKLARDAAPLKGVQDAFIGITEASGTSMDVMLGALKEGTAGMVTNRDLMTSFNKAAQLVSVDFAKTLPDSMGFFGKVALATGQDVGFLMDSYVTGIGRLSPMILDNLGIQVDLTAAYEDFATMNGLVASELTKSQQQTALSIQVNEKLAENTAAMPEVIGSAEQAFASFGVMMTNTKDKIGLAVLPIITKLMDFIGPMLTSAIEKVMPFIERFTDLFGQLISVIGEMGLLSSETEEVLASMFGEEIAAKIMNVLEQMVNLKNVIFDFMTNVLIPFVQEHWEAIKAALIAVGAILAGAAIVSGILAIAGAIAALFSPIGIIIAVVALLAVAWSKNWGDIQGKTKAVIDFIRNLINTALNWIKDFWAAHGEQIMGIVQTIWDTVVGIFQWFVDYYTLIFEAFSAAFSGDWETFGEKIREAWDMVWDAIVAAVETAWEFISTAVSEGIENIITWFKETDWGQVGRDIIQGIANGITAGAQWAIDAIKGVAGAIWDALTGFFGNKSPSKLMASLGIDLMKGLATGITGGSGLPAMAAVGAGAGVVSSITTSTTHSPNFNITANISSDMDIEDLALRLAEVYRTRIE